MFKNIQDIIEIPDLIPKNEIKWKTLVTNNGGINFTAWKELEVSQLKSIILYRLIGNDYLPSTHEDNQYLLLTQIYKADEIDRSFRINFENAVKSLFEGITNLDINKLNDLLNSQPPNGPYIFTSNLLLLIYNLKFVEIANDGNLFFTKNASILHDNAIKNERWEIIVRYLLKMVLISSMEPQREPVYLFLNLAPGHVLDLLVKISLEECLKGIDVYCQENSSRNLMHEIVDSGMETILRRFENKFELIKEKVHEMYSDGKLTYDTIIALDEWSTKNRGENLIQNNLVKELLSNSLRNTIVGFEEIKDSNFFKTITGRASSKYKLITYRSNIFDNKVLEFACANEFHKAFALEIEIREPEKYGLVENQNFIFGDNLNRDDEIGVLVQPPQVIIRDYRSKMIDIAPFDVFIGFHIIGPFIEELEEKNKANPDNKFENFFEYLTEHKSTIICLDDAAKKYIQEIVQLATRKYTFPFAYDPPKIKDDNLALIEPLLKGDKDKFSVCTATAKAISIEKKLPTYLEIKDVIKFIKKYFQDEPKKMLQEEEKINKLCIHTSLLMNKGGIENKKLIELRLQLAALVYFTSSSIIENNFIDFVKFQHDEWNKNKIRNQKIDLSSEAIRIAIQESYCYFPFHEYEENYFGRNAQYSFEKSMTSYFPDYESKSKEIFDAFTKEYKSEIYFSRIKLFNDNLKEIRKMSQSINIGQIDSDLRERLFNISKIKNINMEESQMVENVRNELYRYKDSLMQ